jgi:hypothetical protein
MDVTVRPWRPMFDVDMDKTWPFVLRGVILILAVVGACSTSEAARRERARAPARAASSTPVVPTGPHGMVTAPSLGSEAPLPPVHAVYPWSPRASASSDRLDGRFRSPPAGFVRVHAAPGSFAEFLRTLPLQPEGSPVVDFRGNKLYGDGRHPNIVAVADIDIGTKDLQHCADAIIRLHAEWHYGRGEHDISYRTVSGQALSYRGYVAGDRARLEGKNITVERTAPAQKDDHALFRGWLDDVFSWAGTSSLERDGTMVSSAAEMRAGDFFVMRGAPFGHAVLILDVARDERGRTALLLGQSYVPAQSFQVLATAGSPWFIVEPGDVFVNTPFWRPFPMTSLRRL